MKTLNPTSSAQPHAWKEIATATGEIVWAAPLAGVELPDWPGRQVLMAYVVLPQAEEITPTLPIEQEATP